VRDFVSGAYINDTVEGYGYKNIFVLDTYMNVIVPVGNTQLDPVVQSAVEAAIRNRNSALVDVHHNPDGTFNWGFAKAVFANGEKNGAVIGAVYLKRSVDKYFFPLLLHWPSAILSGETLLARRDGDDIVYINALRLKPGSFPLSERHSVYGPKTIAHRALIDGETGLLSGIDYRGVEVVAAAKTVNNTPWIIITKIDRRETEYLANIASAIFLAVGIFVTSAVVVAFWASWRMQSRDDVIAEQKSAAIKIAKYVAEIERSNADLEQFAYVASHDLREPLRMVNCYLSLLEQRFGDRLEPDGHEFIGFARDGAKRMDQMVLDLLEFSRVGRSGNSIGAMPVLPAIQMALDNLAIIIDECGATLTIDEVLSSSWVMGDHIQIMRLFQNLIGNGIKYRNSGIVPTIHISGRHIGGYWEFSVADNGIGIAPEHFERIFGIFQRLHTREQFDGTGIGLAVSKKIVERHGGRIWLESNTGQSTTFFFTLKDNSASSDYRI
jgi:signal transduction histidine kinase